MLLWGEYKREHPQRYEYSQFCEHLHRCLKTNKAVMHFEHEPGDKMYIDEYFFKYCYFKQIILPDK